MLRVVLDTNVVVSAMLRGTGPPATIVAKLLGGAFVLVLSPALAEELRRSIAYPRVRRYLRLTADEIEVQLARLEMIADVTPGDLAVSADLRDVHDVPVLVAAVEGRADYVVTGDKDLLVLRQHEGIGIVSPREFLDLLGP